MTTYPHYHAVYPNGDDVPSDALATKRDLAQFLSGEMLDYAAYLDERALGADTMTLTTEQKADFYEDLVVANRLAGYGANLDIDTRESAPLFAGPDGPAKLAESIDHALSVVPAAWRDGVRFDWYPCAQDCEHPDA